MSRTFEVRCACGAVGGHASDLSPSSTIHIVCYCDDCRAFAHFLDRADLVGPHGGARIVQMTPRRLRIDRGRDEIRSMRLGPTGMLRFYSACCRSPLGNTLGSARIPFVGVHTSFLAASAVELERALGESIGVQAEFAIGGVPANASRGTPFRLMRRVLPFLAAGFLRGEHAPNSLYDVATGAPVSEPKVLTTSEREALRAFDRDPETATRPA